MKLKQTVLGIVLAFTTVGFVATGAQESDYQKIYEQHERQEVNIKKAINSEFISKEDKLKLENDLLTFDKAKNLEVKNTLLAIIETETKNLKDVESNLAIEETKVAVSEQLDLNKTLVDLENKSKEAYVLEVDSNEVTNLSKELNELGTSKKVEPIRTIAIKVDSLSKQITENQNETIQLVDELREFNKQAESINNEKYLLASDKKLLEQDSKENSQFFEDASNLDVVEERQNDSKKLLTEISKRIEKTNQDFKENEDKSKELITSINNLLTNGNLTSEETTKLKNQITSVQKLLELTDYKPGSLANNYSPMKADYDSYLINSEKRIEEAKKKVEEEARELAKLQEETRKKEEADALKQAEIVEQQTATNNNDVSTPNVVGGWHQAPEGYKFLKVESGKTYGQVKNPNNFSLITIAEAANYSPGHGNGSAKQ